MKNNNEIYWKIAMKFYDLEDGDVNKLKKDIDDQNSDLYGLMFAWNNIKHEGKIKGLCSFKENFTRFFGSSIPSEERKFWDDHIDKVNKLWNKFIEGREAWKIK